jgi:diguanylate cyclase (GGDEF)-like protein
MLAEQKLARIGILVALVLLVAVGFLSDRSAREQARSAAWVAHTHEVIGALERIAGDLAEAESSLRGYAVTRDPRFLADFEPAIRDAAVALELAEQLTGDNAPQLAALERVKPLLARRMELLRFREGRLRAGAKAEIPDEARRLTESIRAILGSSIARERMLLEQRRVLVERRTARARNWSTGGLVLSVALVLVAFLLLDREMRRRREVEKKLREQSISDPLTGLFNRRFLEETLTRELSRAKREQRPLALVLLDVDHFKRVNDTYGHDAGDAVLKAIASLLRAETRGGDVASRLGGEELLVVLPGASVEQARAKAEGLRAKISELVLESGAAPIGPVTASFGVSAFPKHGEVAEELMKSADKALYRAKHGGRNQVMVAEEA